MIVSPRRLILAITLAPPVNKIKQRLICLTIHYMRIKNLGNFFLSAYTLYADKANLLDLGRMSSTKQPQCVRAKGDFAGRTNTPTDSRTTGLRELTFLKSKKNVTR